MSHHSNTIEAVSFVPVHEADLGDIEPVGNENCGIDVIDDISCGLLRRLGEVHHIML